MKFSAAREPITPDWSIHMAGFSSRTSTSTGIYDKLYSTSLMLDDGVRKILIIALDVCEIDGTFVSGIKRLVKAKYGMDEKDIIIHSIHTHSGPVTYVSQDGLYESIREDVIKYRKVLEEKVMKNVDDCMSSPREGHLEAGIGETFIGMSRRKETPEGFKIGPNINEDILRKTFALTIKGAAGRIEAVLFSCPCHPVTLLSNNLYISADYPGAARREIEKKYPGATAIFLQGPGGDINPAVMADGDNYRTTSYSDVLLTGKILANDIFNILKGGMHRIDLSLDTCMDSVMIPLDWDKPAYYDASSDGREPSSVGLKKEGRAQITLVRLSKDMRIVCLDGEVCNQVGVHITDLFEDGFTMVIGCSNGYIGYIPTPKIINEGGYEAGYSMLDAPYTEDMEGIILEKIKVMTRGII